MKPKPQKKLKMSLRIVADDVRGIQAALGQLSKERLASNEYAERPDIRAETDYDFVISDNVFRTSRTELVVNPYSLRVGRAEAD